MNNTPIAFILYHGQDYEGKTTKGVFPTLEEAISHANKRHRQQKYGGYGYDYLSVEGWQGTMFLENHEADAFEEGEPPTWRKLYPWEEQE